MLIVAPIVFMFAEYAIVGAKFYKRFLTNYWSDNFDNEVPMVLYPFSVFWTFSS